MMLIELWDRPVEVSFNNGDHFHSVRNSREALTLLLAKWPIKGGSDYAAAKRVCLENITVQSRSQAACAAFLKAASAAGILRS